MRPEPRPVPKKPARMAKPASTTGTLRSEAGAALVLVLVFMIVGGLIVGALTEAVTNGLKNTTNFATARSAQYDAFSATNLAIQSIRHLPLMSASQTLNASPPTSCVPTGVSEFHGSSDGNGNDVSVWCSTVWNAGAIDTRVVTLSACLSSVLPLACAASPMLQAVVTFDDYPPGISVVSLGQCVAYCGTSMTVNSWIRSPVVPSVTGISTATLPTLVATGDINGKALVTINGSGFVSAATVNFVEESNLVPTVDNVIIPATGVNVNSDGTSLTVLSPSVTVATTYFVTVTTPGGTSAYAGAGDVFGYSAVPPIVTGIVTPGVRPPEGSTSGGSFVAITGSGFVSGASVAFVDTADSTIHSAATFVTVVSNTSITAVSPPVTVAGNYYVVVKTSAGKSGSTAASIFASQAQVPIAASILPVSGAAGTPVIITGVGFVIGATVNFVQESAGTAAGVSISVIPTRITASSITVAAPSPATTGTTTYFVTVTTGSVTSNSYPVFTY